MEESSREVIAHTNPGISDLFRVLFRHVTGVDNGHDLSVKVCESVCGFPPFRGAMIVLQNARGETSDLVSRGMKSDTAALLPELKAGCKPWCWTTFSSLAETIRVTTLCKSCGDCRMRTDCTDLSTIVIKLRHHDTLLGYCVIVTDYHDLAGRTFIELFDGLGAFVGMALFLLARESEGVAMSLKGKEDFFNLSERYAKALLDAIPDLMFRINREGTYLDYKAAHDDLYHQSTPLIGKRNRDIAPPDIADLVEEKIFLTLERGEMQVFEYQISIPGKGVREFEARMVPSGLSEVTAIVRDITDRKRSELALKNKVDELEWFNRLMVDRELRMIELKIEVNDLARQLGFQERYIIHQK